jgi:hypothetical protein
MNPSHHSTLQPLQLAQLPLLHPSLTLSGDSTFCSSRLTAFIITVKAARESFSARMRTFRRS